MGEQERWRPSSIEPTETRMSWFNWAGFAFGVVAIVVMVVAPVWIASSQASLVPCGPLRSGLVEESAMRIDSGVRGSTRRTWTTRVRFPEGDGVSLPQPLPTVHRGDRVTIQGWCDAQGRTAARLSVEQVEHIGH